MGFTWSGALSAQTKLDEEAAERKALEERQQKIMEEEEAAAEPPAEQASLESLLRPGTLKHGPALMS